MRGRTSEEGKLWKDSKHLMDFKVVLGGDDLRAELSLLLVHDLKPSFLQHEHLRVPQQKNTQKHLRRQQTEVAVGKISK